MQLPGQIWMQFNTEALLKQSQVVPGSRVVCLRLHHGFEQCSRGIETLEGELGDRLIRSRDTKRRVRAGCILTVSDVMRADASDTAVGHEAWFRPHEDEVTRAVDVTVGAALAAAAALGRSA